jgi:hypothetical protein
MRRILIAALAATIGGTGTANAHFYNGNEAYQLCETGNAYG